LSVAGPAGPFLQTSFVSRAGAACRSTAVLRLSHGSPFIGGNFLQLSFPHHDGALFIHQHTGERMTMIEILRVQLVGRKGKLIDMPEFHTILDIWPHDEGADQVVILFEGLPPCPCKLAEPILLLPVVAEVHSPD
jgi:hypothetical protein